VVIPTTAPQATNPTPDAGVIPTPTPATPEDSNGAAEDSPDPQTEDSEAPDSYNTDSDNPESENPDSDNADEEEGDEADSEGEEEGENDEDEPEEEASSDPNVYELPELSAEEVSTIKNETGERLCVAGITGADSLAVRTGPSSAFDLVANLDATSCAIWWTGESSGTWYRVVLLSDLGDQQLSIRHGWLSSNFVAPVDQVNSPNAAVVDFGKSWVPDASAGPTCVVPTEAPLGLQVLPGDVLCSVRSFFWDGDGVCTGDGQPAWRSDGGGPVQVRQGADGQWAIVQPLVLLVQC